MRPTTIWPISTVAEENGSVRDNNFRLASPSSALRRAAHGARRTLSSYRKLGITTL